MGKIPGVVGLAASHLARRARWIGGGWKRTATVSKDHQAKIQAGKIIQTIAPLIGGKGSGKPDFARCGGKEVNGLEAALVEAKRLAAG